MSAQTLLLEIGTEELPPKSLKQLSRAFCQEILAGLIEAELISTAQGEGAICYASPRRLAISVPEVQNSQPDQHIERRGPAVAAAFNQNGEATAAALGFAKSCGVEVGELEKMQTDKGEWLVHRHEQNGKSIAELIAGIVDRSVKRLPIPKRMRWGSTEAEFVRPVQWLLALHGSDQLPLQLLNKSAGNNTRGHRFHGSDSIPIQHADDYAKTLLDKGYVVADFAQRQRMISDQIEQLAKSVGGCIEPDQALLDEVTGLVEYPAAIIGNFDVDFLQVPQECLISSMRDHQKYFHLKNKNGELMPNFITVSNIQSRDSERVIKGNERVLQARLADARFFWETDQKISLADRADSLANVLFHTRLGSIADKSERLAALAVILAEQIGADADIAARAASLSKADLVSDMVNEFDELQGIMGHYYADRDGENPLVGESIEQQYWPRFAGDHLPRSKEAQALALADKLDSLVGIYAAGEIPTGDRDPYGLRRAALGILRILIENKHALDFRELIANTAQVYAGQQQFEVDAQTQADIGDFITGRLTAYYRNQNIATTVINAVKACEPDNPVDFENRVKAVDQFSRMAEADDLVAANKRISNILKKQENAISTEVNPDLLVEAAEQSLNTAIDAIAKNCCALFETGDYNQGLQQLAALRSPVDEFFEHVMVMSDDPEQQRNRLALLNKVRQLFLQVADVSLLQS